MSQLKSGPARVLGIIAEGAVWLLPIGLIRLSHVMGWIKVDGDYLVVNERTLWVERLWHWADDHAWAIGLYAVALLACMAILRFRRCSTVVRVIVLVILSLPSIYYFLEMGYLAGKFVQMDFTQGQPIMP